MENLMLAKGKEDLKKDLINVVGKITKEVTNDVIKNTAVVSVQDLNIHISNIKKDSENIINNLNVAKNNYYRMLEKNNLALKDIDKNINLISNKLLQLDSQVNLSQEKIVNIVNTAVNNGIKASAISVLSKELSPSLKDLNKYIEKTVIDFQNLNKNINDASKIQNETKQSLVELENNLSKKISIWEHNQKNLNTSIENLNNQYMKKNDELINLITNNFFNFNAFFQKICQNTNIIINNTKIASSEIIDKLNLIEQNQLQILLNKENEIINILNVNNSINNEFNKKYIEDLKSLKRFLYIDLILTLFLTLLFAFIVFSVILL